MKRQNGKKFADKHGSGAQIDSRIKDALGQQTRNNEVPCAVAFKIADALQVSPADVGKTADLLELELVKCQLGLFGYKPDKKIVKPKAAENPDLEQIEIPRDDRRSGTGESLMAQEKRTRPPRKKPERVPRQEMPVRPPGEGSRTT